MMKPQVTNGYAHAQELTPNFGELYRHLLGKTTSVRQVADTFVRTEHISMTLSGMAVAVVPSAHVAASTLHRGSASNFPSLPLITLNLDFVARNLSALMTHRLK